MWNKQSFRRLLFVWFFAIVAISCQKKGDFINEEKVGSGIHYYPVILNDTYYDTLTEKFFQDTVFSRGQKIVFQLKYRSMDSPSKIELWGAETGEKAEKLWETAYSDSFYSETQKSDTTFINFQLPAKLDSTVSTFILYPKVVTKQGLETKSNVELQIK